MRPYLLQLIKLLVVTACTSLAVSRAADDEDGFVPLFDGKSLTGWIGAVDGYEARDGAIVCVQAKGGNLFTEREFANFVLRFEVKIPAGGNNGIAIRAPNQTGNLAYDAIEIQVLDDDDPQYAKIKPYQHHGSVYGLVPAKTGSLRPDGEWNEEEITVDGRRITVTVNGQKIVDVDLDEATKDGTADDKAHPGLQRTSGHVGFLGHGSAVAFRNLRIKELPASK